MDSRRSGRGDGRDGAGGRALGWIIAALAVIGLIVAVVLLTRANERAGELEVELGQQETTFQRQLRGAEARARVASLQAALRSNLGEEELRDQVRSTVEALRDSYADAEGEAAETWRAIEADLAGLEGLVAEERDEAIATLDRVRAQLAPAAEVE